jgi:MinD superfamily P-loop ATPase
MKTITILSGKGGVGKSSITASLAVSLSRHKKIVCADCDVDASNLALVFGIDAASYEEWTPLSIKQKAQFDHEKCTSCGKCAEHCYFNAIELEGGKPRLKEFNCEGCGVCVMVCPADAITMKEVQNANIGYATTPHGFTVVSAQLDIGASGSGMVVSAVKRKAASLAGDADIMLVDSAAGIGCPVIASVTGSDYVVVVAEPTPPGVADMKRVLEVVKHFRIPYGFIINKHDMNKTLTKDIEGFAKRNAAQVLARIPYDKAFTEALVNMTPLVEHSKKYAPLFEELAKKVGGV